MQLPTSSTPMLSGLPPEILLRLLSYLDLPDLLSLTRTSHYLRTLSLDPILHHERLYITTPSRINHSLFRRGGPKGEFLRPSVQDLVRRGVFKHLVGRRWREGSYLCSPLQYRIHIYLQRKSASRAITSILRRRLNNEPQLVLPPRHSDTSISNDWKRSQRNREISEGGTGGKTPGPYPDIEFFSPTISRRLLPAIRQLKWSLRRDQLAKTARLAVQPDPTGRVSKWMEGRGYGIVQDGERVRLAVCPGVRKMVRFYEGLMQAAK